jgi:hypothetical protein
MNFSPVIFWDVDYSKIDWIKSKRFVIGRVVRYGTVQDWIALKKKYGLELIKAEMLEEKDLDDRTLSFLSCVLDVPKEKFKCYRSKQLHPAHFNF